MVATVNRDNNITGKIEKWEAHKKGILHKGFTIILTYNGQYLLQHRKHPAFDDTFDLTISSHPLYIDNILQDDETAIYQALERELHLAKKDLVAKPQYKGTVWYKAKDRKSSFIEHEMDAIYVAEIKRVPDPDPEYSYDLILQSRDQLKDNNLAPWVESFLKDNVLI